MCVCARMFVCVLLDVMMVDKVLGASAVILSHTDRYAARTPSRQCYADPHSLFMCVSLHANWSYAVWASPKYPCANFTPKLLSCRCEKRQWQKRSLIYTLFRIFFTITFCFLHQKLCRNKWKLQSKTKVKNVFYHREVFYWLSFFYTLKNQKSIWKMLIHKY